jgi:anti-anti-sigma factor
MLEVQTKKLETVAILCLRGPVITGETETLRNAVYSLSGVNAIILDMAGVTAVDAGGLGVLLELRAYAQSKAVRLELMNVNKWVRRVFEMVRLDSVFKITSGVEFFPSLSRSRSEVMSKLASCA